MARAVPALLGVALVLSLASLAYQQVRTQRQRDAEVIAKLRRQLVEAEQAKLAALSQLKEAQGGGAGQQAGAHSFIHSVDTLPYQRDDLVMMTFATGGVRDMLDNWVRHVRVLKLPILVAAMDEVVLSQCKSEGFECYSCVKEKDDMPRYIRGDFAGFRALGVRKVDALLPILRRGVHVILSDVDAVWLHDPNPMVRGVTPGFEDFAHADMIVSTDCHNPESDFDNAGCFGDLLDKNTGVMYVRATPNGIAAMAEWRVRLAAGQRDEQDQTTFMDLVDGNGRGHRWGMTPPGRDAWKKFARDFCGPGQYVKGFAAYASSGQLPHTEGSRRVMNVCLPNVTKSLLLGIFPITEVANGHTFFIQQLHTLTGRWPMAIHATFQYGDMPDYAFGKRQRFRDWGMWLVDDDEEYITSSRKGGQLLRQDARYLVLEDEQPLAPGRPWLGYADLHNRGRQHVEHLEHTRQRLAHGVALARILNRTLVLPHMWCYCDKYWHRLDQCATPNAATAQPLPFVCPMDHVVDPALWHGTTSFRTARPMRGMQAARADGPWQDGVPFRGRNWLQQLGSYPHIRMSSATLAASRVPDDVPRSNSSKSLMTPQLLSQTRSGSDALRKSAEARLLTHEFVPGTEGPRISLEPRQTDATLRKALGVYDHVRLLHVAMGDAGALLRCFEEPSHQKAMKDLVALIFQHRWCYRPKEMAANWTDMYQWCVWGFAEPAVAPVCT